MAALMDEIEGVVGNHKSDGEADDPEINHANAKEKRKIRFRRYMDQTQREPRPGTGMAFAASRRQIGFMHVRARVRGRSYVVHPMTAGAIGGGQLSGAQRQSVKTVLKCRDFVWR